MKPIKKTLSLCPECLKKISADVYEEGGKVWISKKCEKHGVFKDLYWGSYDMYMRAKKYANDGVGVENPNVAKEKPDCPRDCGLCKLHKSHTALANIAVTNRCDLRCWYCFYYAQKQGYVYEPTLRQIRDMIKTLRNEKPVPCNALQITGGEPTMRKDLIEIIKIAKEEGMDHVQLNTNGINISRNLELTKKLREAGVNTLYLSFDGVSAKTNPKNHWEVPGVLENCRKAGIGVVLVPTVIKSVNDNEIGAIIKYASDNMDIVKSVNYQPVSLVGRMPRTEREKYRITIPDTIQKIEEQTDGQITKDDFYPVPASMPFSNFVEAFTKKPQYKLSTHFACGMGTYVFKEDGKLLPITRFVNIDGLLEYLDEKAGDIKSGKSKHVAGLKLLYKIGSFIDKEKQPKEFSLAKLLYNALVKHNYEALGEFHRKSLFIGMMHFQDLYNYDIERVNRCCIHYAMPEGRIIPFCAFNVVPEWYRDKSQKKFGISIKEWEKQTGRKLSDDFYTRKTK